MSHQSKWREHAEKACVRIEAYGSAVDFARPDLTPKQTASVGTGFFVDANLPDGWYCIVTCAHVVANCIEDQIAVFFPKVGKNKFNEGLFVNSVCPSEDIAVLRMRVTDPAVRANIRPLPLSAVMPKGSAVTSFGYPAGQDELSETTGKYSAFQGNGHYQHDASISPGNSGGPLVREDTGECVGINASTMVGGGVSGVHYAVPIVLFQRLAEKMVFLEGGGKRTVVPPILGVCYHKATEALVNKVSPSAAGLYVYFVLRKSTAGREGIQPGTVITDLSWETSPGGAWSAKHAFDRHGMAKTSWNGDQSVAMEHILNRVPLRSKIRLTCVKDGSTRVVETTMQPFQEGAYKIYSTPLEAVPDHCFWGGICVMVLCHNHREQFYPVFKALGPEKLAVDSLVVTYVLPNYDDVPFEAGAILQLVNGRGVAGEKGFDDTVSGRMDSLEAYRTAIKSDRTCFDVTCAKGQRYVVDGAKLFEREKKNAGGQLYTPDKDLLDFFSK